MNLEQKTLEQLYTMLDAICLNKRLGCSIRLVTTTHSGVTARNANRKPNYILEVYGYRPLKPIVAETRIELLRQAIPIIKQEIAKGGL